MYINMDGVCIAEECTALGEETKWWGKENAPGHHDHGCQKICTMPTVATPNETVTPGHI